VPFTELGWLDALLWKWLEVIETLEREVWREEESIEMLLGYRDTGPEFRRLIRLLIWLEFYILLAFLFILSKLFWLLFVIVFGLPFAIAFIF
jgi:hypothetical protein